MRRMLVCYDRLFAVALAAIALSAFVAGRLALVESFPPLFGRARNDIGG